MAIRNTKNPIKDQERQVVEDFNDTIEYLENNTSNIIYEVKDRSHTISADYTSYTYKFEYYINSNRRFIILNSDAYFRAYSDVDQDDTAYINIKILVDGTIKFSEIVCVARSDSEGGGVRGEDSNLFSPIIIDVGSIGDHRISIEYYLYIKEGRCSFSQSYFSINNFYVENKTVQPVLETTKISNKSSTIQLKPYINHLGSTHKSTDWVITNKTTNSILVSSLNDTTNLLSYTYDFTRIAVGNIIEIKVRFRDSNDLYSEYTIKNITLEAGSLTLAYHIGLSTDTAITNHGTSAITINGAAWDNNTKEISSNFNDYIRLDDESVFDNVNFSFFGWFKFTAFSGYNTLLSIIDTTDNDYLRFVYSNIATKLYVYDGTNLVEKTSLTLNLNTYYHIGYTINGTTVKIYLDGVLQVTGTVTLSSAVKNDKVGLFIDMDTSVSSSSKFRGRAKDIRVYYNVLTQTQITKLHTDGAQ